MQSNRVTLKLFQSAVQTPASPPPKSSSTKLPNQTNPLNQTSQLSQSSQSSQYSQSSQSSHSSTSSSIPSKSPNILSQSTPSFTSNQNQNETFEHELIKNRNRIEKSKHIEGVVYNPSKPMLGIVILFTQKTHVYLKFHPYVNQVKYDINGVPRVEETNIKSIEFCIEDTPTYEFSESPNDVTIQFVLGRKLTIEIHPIIMSKEAFQKFKMFLRNFGVTLKEGIVTVEKKPMQFDINITNYLEELRNDDETKIKYENWKIMNQIEDMKIITEEDEWIDEIVLNESSGSNSLKTSREEMDSSNSNSKIEMNQIDVDYQNKQIIQKQNDLRKRLFFKGTNDSQRMNIWMKCLKAKMDKTIFDKIKIQVENLVDIQIQNNTELRREIEQIQKDIKRTTITESVLELWKRSIFEIKETMTTLLKMWCLYNMNEGYYQGMNEIILGLMEFSTNEFDIFTTFVKLMEMMNKILKGKICIDDVIMPIIKCVDPDLESYFSMMKIGYSFMCQWVVILFRRDFIQKHCVRLWDCIFAHPEDKFYYFIATAMLLQHRNLILTNRLALDDITIFFCQMENKFDDSILMDAEMCLKKFKQFAPEKDKNVVFNQ